MHSTRLSGVSPMLPFFSFFFSLKTNIAKHIIVGRLFGTVHPLSHSFSVISYIDPLRGNAMKKLKRLPFFPPINVPFNISLTSSIYPSITDYYNAYIHNVMNYNGKSTIQYMHLQRSWIINMHISSTATFPDAKQPKMSINIACLCVTKCV